VIRRANAEDGPAIAVVFRRSFGTLTFLPTLHAPEEDRAFFDGFCVVELTNGSGNEEREPDMLYEWRPEERK
jgi:hypothetical protein